MEEETVETEDKKVAQTEVVSELLDFKKSMDEVVEIRADLRKMRFDSGVGQLDDTSQFKKKKKKIAQILTKISASQTRKKQGK